MSAHARTHVEVYVVHAGSGCRRRRQVSRSYLALVNMRSLASSQYISLNIITSVAFLELLHGFMNLLV
jgi:hypothetical protein